MKIYEVYIPETNEVVFTGTSRQIAAKFNVSYANIYMYKKKCKLCRKYQTRYVGDIDVPNEKPKKMSKHERTLEYLIKHLNLYGNVYLNEDPDKYLDELKKLGYRVKIDKYLSPRKKDFIICEVKHFKKKGKYDTDYILTRLI